MRWRLPALLLAAAATLVWLAGAGLAAQLEAGARAEAELYLAGSTPYRWQFSNPDAVVGPPLGLRVLGSDAGGLLLALDGDSGELGLRFSGRRVDPRSLPRLRLALELSGPVQLQLAAAPDLRESLESGTAQALQPGDQALELRLRQWLPTGDAHLAQLRLRFAGDAGTELRLRSFELLPEVCDGAPCLPPRTELDLPAGGARALAARDLLLLATPQQRIGAASPTALSSVALSLRALSTSAALLAAIALLVLAALLGRLTYPRSSGRIRARIALAFGAGLPMLALAFGLPRFPAQIGDACLMASWALSLWLLRPRSANSPKSSLAKAWLSAAALSSVAVLALLLLVAWAGLEPWAATRGLVDERLPRYTLWACLQQIWLARFALPHLRTLGCGNWTLPAAALLFAGLHLPNLELMGLTLLGGFGWAWLADRHGRLLPQTASHVVLGIASVALLPDWLLRSAEVGGRFVFAPL